MISKYSKHVIAACGFILLSFCVTAQMQKWTARYNGPGNQNDEADFIYVDAQGNAYAGGSAYDTTRVNDTTVVANQHITVVKYDSTGTQLWVGIDTGSVSTSADGMTVDPYGDIFFTGYADNFTLGHFIVVKFDSSGTFKWQKYYGK